MKNTQCAEWAQVRSPNAYNITTVTLPYVRPLASHNRTVLAGSQSSRPSCIRAHVRSHGSTDIQPVVASQPTQLSMCTMRTRPCRDADHQSASRACLGTMCRASSPSSRASSPSWRGASLDHRHSASGAGEMKTNLPRLPACCLLLLLPATPALCKFHDFLPFFCNDLFSRKDSKTNRE